MPTTGNKVYWFPAKRYGWGWGLPVVWQGWLVMAIFAGLLVVGAVFVLPSNGPVAFVIHSTLVSAVLVIICWAKGEPPRWRWGGK
jgi:hypothetical protein